MPLAMTTLVTAPCTALIAAFILATMPPRPAALFSPIYSSHNSSVYNGVYTECSCETLCDAMSTNSSSTCSKQVAAAVVKA
jgi:hypothetical protein